MMPEAASWKECIEKKIITQSTPDNERAIQMLKMADIRIEFWSKKVKNKFISLKIEAYYDIIKELAFTHMYKKGFKCKNHVCMIAYLKEKFDDFEFETEKINELRKVRNEISYRGFFVHKDYLDRNELEFKHIIRKLKNKINK